MLSERHPDNSNNNTRTVNANPPSPVVSRIVRSRFINVRDHPATPIYALY